LKKKGRWGDGEMGRWGDGEMGRRRKYFLFAIFYLLFAICYLLFGDSLQFRQNRK
jgi:hypothetical protein